MTEVELERLRFSRLLESLDCVAVAKKVRISSLVEARSHGRPIYDLPGPGSVDWKQPISVAELLLVCVRLQAVGKPLGYPDHGGDHPGHLSTI